MICTDVVTQYKQLDKTDRVTVTASCLAEDELYAISFSQDLVSGGRVSSCVVIYLFI